MSASLVGSEMCIRDRHGPSQAAAARQAAPGGSSADLLRGPGKHGARTVSYTHLTLPTICSV
eukprot:10149327-Alexandrium_andersonii.AAC.1